MLIDQPHLKDRLASARADSFYPRPFANSDVSALTNQTKRGPWTLLERFGKRLRDLRVERNLTQLELAKFLGINLSFLSDVERGKKAMTLTYIQTVAQGFGMSISELLADL